MNECLTYANLVLWCGHAVTAVMLARRIGRLRVDQAEHRRVIGGLIEARDTTKGRIGQIEKQLGRTMRHAGVPGLEQPPEAPVAT